MCLRIIEFALASLFSSLLGYGLAVFCHEIGHLLAGKWNQGDFLMLRVGRLVWVSGKRRCFISRENFLSPGQCILVCGSRKGCCRTALGGCAANFATAGIAVIAGGVRIALCQGSWQEFFWFYSFLLSFITISALMAVVNLIPIPLLSKEINDGKLWALLKREHGTCEKFMKEQRRCQFLLEEGQIAELLE